VTVRLPGPVVDYIDAHMTEQIHNRSEFLQHWAMVGMLVSQNEEIAEGLDWALGQWSPPRDPDPQPVVETPASIDTPMPQDAIDFENDPETVVVGGPAMAEIYEDMLTQFRSKVR